MPEAARYGDQIGHTSALAGLIIGALAGIAIAVAVVAIVGTGGVAAVAIGAGIAAAGAGGALSGAYIGELIPTSPTGGILTGAVNVFIGGLALMAARAGRDIARCSGILPHGTPVIAQGSSTVFVNGMMAARKGDKLVCGASISKGCSTVIIGGPTATVPGLTIESEVPGWLTTALWVVMIAGTIVATGGAALVFGVGPALGGLIGGLAGSFALGWVGGKVGRAVGEMFGNPELGERIGEVTGGLIGGLLGGWAGAKGGGRLLPRGPSPSLVERAGTPSPPTRIRPQERGVRADGSTRTGDPPLHPELQEARPGQPVKLDPDRNYLYAVMEDGTVRVAPDIDQPFTTTVDGEPVTVPRGAHPNVTGGNPARLAGELNYDRQTGTWIMDNNSGRYGFVTADGTPRTPDNLNAAANLLRASGTEGPIQTNWHPPVQ